MNIDYRRKRKIHSLSRFTLIELLVVVTIIAILVAMLLPMLAKTKDRAKVVLCLGNHRQITMASLMYARDEENWLVLHKWYTDSVGWKGNHNWSPVGYRRLNAYLGGDSKDDRPPQTDGAAKISQCPSDRGDTRNSWNTHTWTRFGTSYSTQYASVQHCGINRSTSSGEDNTTWFTPMKLNMIKMPEYKVSHFSGHSWNNNRDWMNPKTRWHNQAPKNARIPCGFMDGHAENFHIWWRPTNIMPSRPNYRTQLNKYIDRFGYY